MTPSSIVPWRWSQWASMKPFHISADSLFHHSLTLSWKALICLDFHMSSNSLSFFPLAITLTGRKLIGFWPFIKYEWCSQGHYPDCTINMFSVTSSINMHTFLCLFVNQQCSTSNVDQIRSGCFCCEPSWSFLWAVSAVDRPSIWSCPLLLNYVISGHYQFRYH